MQERQKDRRTEGQKGRKTERQKDRKTEGNKDKKTEGHKDRKTYRQHFVRKRPKEQGANSFLVLLHPRCEKRRPG
jgi:hypothetical protein